MKRERQRVTWEEDVNSKRVEKGKNCIFSVAKLIFS